MRVASMGLAETTTWKTVRLGIHLCLHSDASTNFPRATQPLAPGPLNLSIYLSIYPVLTVRTAELPPHLHLGNKEAL